MRADADPAQIRQAASDAGFDFDRDDREEDARRPTAWGRPGHVNGAESGGQPFGASRYGPNGHLSAHHGVSYGVRHGHGPSELRL